MADSRCLETRTVPGSPDSRCGVLTLSLQPRHRPAPHGSKWGASEQRRDGPVRTDGQLLPSALSRHQPAAEIADLNSLHVEQASAINGQNLAGDIGRVESQKGDRSGNIFRLSLAFQGYAL